MEHLTESTANGHRLPRAFPLFPCSDWHKLRKNWRLNTEFVSATNLRSKRTYRCISRTFHGLYLTGPPLWCPPTPQNIPCLWPMCYNSSKTSNVCWWSKTASNNSSVISFVIRAAGQSLIAISSQSNLQLKSAVMSPAGRMRPFFMYNGGRVMTERTDNDRRSRKKSKARELPHTRMSLWRIERENR